jgi:hypothetical protein
VQFDLQAAQYFSSFVPCRLLAGFIPAMEANMMLEHKVASSFLIRFSKTRPGSFAGLYGLTEPMTTALLTCFDVVTFVDHAKQIKHVLLFNVEPYGMTLRTPPKIYSSLKEFAVAHSGTLSSKPHPQLSEVFWLTLPHTQPN